MAVALADLSAMATDEANYSGVQFDLAAQFVVVRAGLSEKTLACARVALQRRVIKLLNPLPVFIFHPAFLRAACAKARTWPIASRGLRFSNLV
jgi:hypothetical protein